MPDAIGGLKELEHLDLFGCGPRCDNASVGAMRQSSVMCPLLPPALFVRCTKLKSLVLGYNYGLVLTESIGLLHGGSHPPLSYRTRSLFLSPFRSAHARLSPTLTPPFLLQLLRHTMHTPSPTQAHCSTSTSQAVG